MAKVKKVFQSNIFQDNAFQDTEWGGADDVFQTNVFQNIFQYAFEPFVFQKGVFQNDVFDISFSVGGSYINGDANGGFVAAGCGILLNVDLDGDFNSFTEIEINGLDEQVSYCDLCIYSSDDGDTDGGSDDGGSDGG